ncbi:hypothetical protein [Blastococcus sp. TF02A-30]|uniref:hypothetical protein n=1 Tax=Blastococcus sp. TF02A-30 TaxID=2250580 RepID=UPI000DEB55F8|nr:hypothetical protein [Blastococcus sp. TF02A-30]RBY84850.1 hypothetical protein DQ241_16145 [Blastococcus sp. TF02A-30]
MTQPYGPPPSWPAAPAEPTPPQRQNLLPWLLAGLAVLLAGAAVVATLLLTGDDDVEPRPAAGASTSEPAVREEADRTEEPAEQADLGSLPTGTLDTAVAPIAGAAYAGSGEVAFAWVQALATGDFETAYDLSCADVRIAATSAAEGGDPAWELATYFYEQTLDGVGFQSGTFTSLEHQPGSATDRAVFDLQMDDGTVFPLWVDVGPDLTVCDFR